jgi:predicted RNase H-like nuclease
MSDLDAAGYPLATRTKGSRESRWTIEVYPHPALLTLLGHAYRVPYKVSKSSKYWKGTTVCERISKLLSEFISIKDALGGIFGPTHIDLPIVAAVGSLSTLKRYEDGLDALVCAWVAVEFLEERAVAYGDDMAAIWVPKPRPVV